LAKIVGGRGGAFPVEATVERSGAGDSGVRVAAVVEGEAISFATGREGRGDGGRGWVHVEEEIVRVEARGTVI